MRGRHSRTLPRKQNLLKLSLSGDSEPGGSCDSPAERVEFS